MTVTKYISGPDWQEPQVIGVEFEEDQEMLTAVMGQRNRARKLLHGDHFVRKDDKRLFDTKRSAINAEIDKLKQEIAPVQARIDKLDAMNDNPNFVWYVSAGLMLFGAICFLLSALFAR